MRVCPDDRYYYITQQVKIKYKVDDLGQCSETFTNGTNHRANMLRARRNVINSHRKREGGRIVRVRSCSVAAVVVFATSSTASFMSAVQFTAAILFTTMICGTASLPLPSSLPYCILRHRHCSAIASVLARTAFDASFLPSAFGHVQSDCSVSPQEP